MNYMKLGLAKLINAISFDSFMKLDADLKPRWITIINCKLSSAFSNWGYD